MNAFGRRDFVVTLGKTYGPCAQQWPIVVSAVKRSSRTTALNDHPKLESLGNWHFSMANVEQRPYVPAKKINTKYPLIDSDPHIKRVLKYGRTSDYFAGAAFGASVPGLMLLWERIAPSHVGKGGFASIMRLAGAIGVSAGFILFYQRSIMRFYGFAENKREVEMDMKEMVAKVKAGEPLYGVSTLTPYMQGVASRNSRYSGVFLHVLPWFNFVNHNQHGVETAKYYQQAERELEAERVAKGETGS